MFKRKNHPLKGNNGRRITRYLIIAVLPLALCWVLVTRQSHRWTVNISRMNAQNMLLSIFPTCARNSAATKIRDAANVMYRIKPSLFLGPAGTL